MKHTTNGKYIHDNYQIGCVWDCYHQVLQLNIYQNSSPIIM